MGPYLDCSSPEDFQKLLALPCLAIKARALISMAGEKPARGRALYEKIRIKDNCHIIIRNGVIEELGESHSVPIPDNFPVLNLENWCLLPPFVNCHTHLQLSWLAGKTTWNKNFTIWLKSMVPHLIAMTEFDSHAEIIKQVRFLKNSGTGFLGDVGGTISGSLSAIKKACHANGVDLLAFCEWFGFGKMDANPWPVRCRKEIGIAVSCNPAGHALYSTSPEILKAAYSFCMDSGRIFSFHLAESPEETELLMDGSGILADYYRDIVLPPGWKAPGLSPFAYATKLGLLGSNTLAVHGVTLNNEEISQLSSSCASLCLCPRSNVNLNVGVAPVRKMLEKDVLLCLGTDGLSSCEDLNVVNEALFLHKNLDIPWEVLIRLLTVNGLHALGKREGATALQPGCAARFGILPIEIIRDMRKSDINPA